MDIGSFVQNGGAVVSVAIIDFIFETWLFGIMLTSKTSEMVKDYLEGRNIKSSIIFHAF